MAVRFVPGIQTLVIIGVLLTSLLGVPVETLQCGFCAPEECSTEGLDDCAGSKVYDECGCCQRCAPVENEKCGGSLIDYHGECDTGLVCEISPSYGQPITGSEIGVCKKCANQFDGCNVIDEECVCGKACSKDFFKYSSNASCEKARSLTSESKCASVECPSTRSNSIVCPPDSVHLPTIITHDGCCHQNQGCTCKPITDCPAIQCSPGLITHVVSNATNQPGKCCDVVECISAVETAPMEGVCNYDGRIYKSGETWHPDKCSTCSCKNRLALCRAVQCEHHANCGWLIEPPGECCSVCQGCVGSDGSTHNNTEVWEEDKCTTCRCENGQKYCQSSMCDVHCHNPRHVPGSCCPVCDDLPLVLQPLQCPSVENCTLPCLHGLEKDQNGCYICQCKPKCSLECEHGYQVDKYNMEICKCAQAVNNCPSMDWCKKRCMHGFRKDKKTGCQKCRCNRCPAFKCNKDCLYGHEHTSRGCKLCKCIGNLLVPSETTTSPPSTTAVVVKPAAGRKCLSLDGRTLEEGQSWFDGCRQCYCHKGQEMCELITCDVPRCRNPIIRLGDCCPTCIENNNMVPVSGPAACNASDGTYHVEGDTWRLDQCTECVCHHGGILCEIESCPPVLCNQPIQMPNKCCPVCPDREPLFPVVQEHKACMSTSGTIYNDRDMWRANACQSCTCRNGQIHCFSQTCPLLMCNKTILKKGQCCPYCIDTKPPQTCSYNGEEYGPGETWLQENCEKCVCDSGHAMCTQVTCPKLTCDVAVQVQGKCCPKCQNSVEIPVMFTTVEMATRKSTRDYGREGTAHPNDESDKRDIGSYVITICILTAFLILLIILVLVLVCMIQRQQHKNSQPELLSRTQYCPEVKVRPKSTNLDLQGGCPLPTKQSNCETNKVLMTDIHQFMRCSLAMDDSTAEKMQKDNYVCISPEKDSNLSKQV